MIDDEENTSTVAGDSLDKIINKVVEERTFSVEAVAGIKQLRDEHKLAQAKLRDATRALNSQEKTIRDLTTTVNAFESDELARKTEDERLVKQEQELHTKEIEQAADKATATATTHCFDQVFRNIGIRREMFGRHPIPVEGSGSGMSGMIVSSDVNESTEEIQT